MKRIAMIKTGILPPKKVTRKRMSDTLRRKRAEGYRFKRVTFADAKGWQSTCKSDPYIYATVAM